MLSPAALQRCAIPWMRMLMLGYLIAMGVVNAGAQGPGKPFGGQKGAWPYLPLPPERAARVEALQSEWAQRSQIVKRRLGERTMELEQEYSNYRLDEKHIRFLEQEIRDAQAQLMALHHDFQVKLRGLLTEAEFDALIGR